MKTKSDNPNKPPDQKSIFEIPTEGALGLLALGAVGIKAWKKKKKGPVAPEGGTIQNPSDGEIKSDSSDKENSNGE